MGFKGKEDVILGFGIFLICVWEGGRKSNRENEDQLLPQCRYSESSGLQAGCKDGKTHGQPQYKADSSIGHKMGTACDPQDFQGPQKCFYFSFKIGGGMNNNEPSLNYTCHMPTQSSTLFIYLVLLIYFYGNRSAWKQKFPGPVKVVCGSAMLAKY